MGKKRPHLAISEAVNASSLQIKKSSKDDTIQKRTHEPPKKKKKKDKEKDKNKQGTYKEGESIELIENTNLDCVKDEKEKLETKNMHIERIKKSMQRPKMFLNQSDKTAVSIGDVQDLVQFACLGMVSSAHPRWCKLLRVGKLHKVAVIIVSGVNEKWFTKYNHCFTNIKQLFNVSVKVNPGEGKSVVQQFLFLKWRRTRLKKELYMSRLLEKEPNIPKMEESDDSSNEENVENNKPKRSDYILTANQLRWHGYPTPDMPDFVSTNHVEAVNDESPLIAIDCEMSLTHNGQEVTRVSAVNENGELLYDTLVKPYNKILDYLTIYSGITKELLDPVTTRLEEVQKKLLALIPEDAILVGQSLNGDLKALKMYHPHCIDTSALFTNTHKVGLKALTKYYLRRDVQCGKEGHDSIEDAKAAMDLALLKIKKGNNLPNFYRGKKQDLPIESIFQRVTSENKKSAFIDIPGNLKKFYKEPVNCITVMTDAETKKKMRKAVKGEDYDIVFGHLHSFKTLMDGITHEEQVIESTLNNIDRRVGDIYATVPNNSLCMVLLASSTQNIDINNTEMDLYSRCLAGIKYEKEEHKGT